MEEVNNKYKVLFVCLGNICRSPAAHGIFEHIVRENGMEGKIEADSAGSRRIDCRSAYGRDGNRKRDPGSGHGICYAAVCSAEGGAFNRRELE